MNPPWHRMVIFHPIMWRRENEFRRYHGREKVRWNERFSDVAVSSGS